MNVVNIIGRLARDPELRYIPSGKAVCNLVIAVDRGFGDDKQTDWLPVTVWEKTAEFVANYLAKGRLVSVEGRLQSRTYEKDGTKHTAYDVVAHRLSPLGPRPAGSADAAPREEEPARQPEARPLPQPEPDDHDPFADQ